MLPTHHGPARRPQPALASRPVARLAQFAAPLAAISSAEACARSEAAPVPTLLIAATAPSPVAPQTGSTSLGATPCQAPSLVATPAPPPGPIARAVPNVVPNGPNDPLRHDPFKHQPTTFYGGAMATVMP